MIWDSIMLLCRLQSNKNIKHNEWKIIKKKWNKKKKKKKKKKNKKKKKKKKIKNKIKEWH